MRHLFSAIFLLFSLQLIGQEEVKFSITADEEYLNIPVSINLDNFKFNIDRENFELFEISENRERRIQSQLESGYTSRLWFIIDGIYPKNSKREFVIRKIKNPKKSIKKVISSKKENGKLTLFSNEKSILSYQYHTLQSPNNVDPLFQKSAFIHPLRSPSGEILSRIQPPDHYHHYGIWGPWTLTHINDRKVDFWNLGEGEGTVAFAGFISEVTGEVYSGFKALQHHVDFGGKGPDQIAMNEVLDIRVWNSSDNAWIIDYTTTINTPLAQGIMLDAYRYGGGIGFRATEKWTKENSSVLTSEGKTRIDADGSNARWCIVEGDSDAKEGRSGILFLSHPTNFSHPESMRVWPIDANNGRGDMFFEFSPIRHNSWKLDKGNDYVLKYRMIVFDGKIDKETAEMYWNSFSGIPEIQINSKK